MAVQPASRSLLPSVSQAVTPALTRSRDPLRNLARMLPLIDTLTLLLIGAAAAFLGRHDQPWPLVIAVAVAVVATWLAALAFIGAYDTRFLGVGTEEFTKVTIAGVIVAAIAATAAFLAGAQSLRGMFLIGLPASLISVLIERRLVRSWIHRRRRRGSLCARTLVLGTLERCRDVTDQVTEDPSVGLTLVGTHQPPKGAHEPWLADVLQRVAREDIQTVIITPSTHLGPHVVRELAWELAASDVDLLVAPALSDVSGPRVSIRRAPRLPLLHLDEPHLTGAQQSLKRLGDVVVSAIGLIVLAPILLLLAAIVKVSGPGPVLFRQPRVGRSGEVIAVWKLRTMVAGSEHRHEEVLGTPLDRNLDGTDPRVTPVGRVLRRWSLDELPQLWSVLRGDMSLVGPRPLLLSEAAWLEPHGQRRHLMRPGLTGLWQVSGRKEVDWAERIRLDMDYVENWSPALDMVLLVRTVKVVLTGEGAH